MNVSRYQNRETLKFEIEFITPTFLGGANGDAEIRTAPFKSLLRRWWRIVKSNLKPKELWKQESRLFGSTEKDPDSKDGKTPFGKSKIDLKIVKSEIEYGEGRLNFGKLDDSFTNDSPIPLRSSSTGPIYVASYLGYGAVGKRSYIEPGKKLMFTLDVPREHKDDMIQTLYYIDFFGTIGSKSKNGFGSIAVKPIGFDFEDCGIDSQNVNKVLNLKDKNDEDAKDDKNEKKDEKNYPNSIVSDSYGFMIWATEEDARYENIMKTLCDIYVRAKRKLILPLFGAAKESQLPYGAKRLPSLLTLKVAKNDENDRYSGFLIFVPYAVKGWKSDILEQEIEKICEFFDKEKSIERLY